ncbi:MAG: DUF547 domain-containing protein [Bdellovibrionales bacterium]|jgi:hypothetical protein|nr:DUF547 domain-containing protein [Bdellovibrionales bacterium]
MYQIILLLLLITSSCGKKESIVALRDQVKPTNTIIERKINESKKESTSNKNINIYQASTEDLLDLYYSNFITEIKRSKNYDTLVNLYAINELFKTKNKKFLELNNIIMQRFAGFDLFKDKTKKEKISTLINAYNFFTLHLYSKMYNKFTNSPLTINQIAPTSKIPTKFLQETKFFILAGHKISLDEIENSSTMGIITQTQGNDIRIKFALGCVYKSCPFTLPQAYRAEILEEQLNFVTSSNLKLKRILRIDSDNNITYISNRLSLSESTIDLLNEYVNITKQVKINTTQKSLLQNLSKTIPELDFKIRKTRKRNFQKACDLEEDFTPVYYCNQVLYGKKDSEYSKMIHDGGLCISYKKEESGQVKWKINGYLNETSSTKDISLIFDSYKYDQSIELLELKQTKNKVTSHINYHGLSNSLEFDQTKTNDDKLRSTHILCHDTLR